MTKTDLIITVLNLATLEGQDEKVKNILLHTAQDLIALDITGLPSVTPPPSSPFPLKRANKGSNDQPHPNLPAEGTTSHVPV